MSAVKNSNMWYRTNDDYGSWYPNSPRRRGISISPRFGYEGPSSSYMADHCEHCPIHCAGHFKNSQEELETSIHRIESKVDKIEDEIDSIRESLELSAKDIHNALTHSRSAKSSNEENRGHWNELKYHSDSGNKPTAAIKAAGL